MQSHKKLMKRKDVEQLENTSLAAVGLLDHHNAMDACAIQAYTCNCSLTVIQCCEDSSIVSSDRAF